MTNEVIEFPRAVPTWTLEDKLRKARLHAGYDQTQLAAALGMSRGIVSNYERGVGEPQRDTVLLWAVECGVSIEWLMGDHFEVVPNSRFHSLIQGPAGSESEG